MLHPKTVPSDWFNSNISSTEQTQLIVSSMWENFPYPIEDSNAEKEKTFERRTGKGSVTDIFISESTVNFYTPILKKTAFLFANRIGNSLESLVDCSGNTKPKSMYWNCYVIYSWNEADTFCRKSVQCYVWVKFDETFNKCQL